jgi:hypothetical protein
VRVKYSNTWIAPGGLEATFGASIAGRQTNDEADFLRALSAELFARGGRATEFSFRVTRLFSDEAAAIRFAALHLPALPSKAALTLYPDESDVPIGQLPGAVVDGVRVERFVGCSLVLEYAFRGGLFTSEDIEVPTEDDTVKRGVVDLAEGAEFADVAFASDFAGLSPVVPSPSLEVPEGFPSFDVTVRNVTVSGFRAFFQGNAVPGPGYRLHWLALQRS